MPHACMLQATSEGCFPRRPLTPYCTGTIGGLLILYLQACPYLQLLGMRSVHRVPSSRETAPGGFKPTSGPQDMYASAVNCTTGTLLVPTSTKVSELHQGRSGLTSTETLRNPESSRIQAYLGHLAGGGLDADV